MEKFKGRISLFDDHPKTLDGRLEPRSKFSQRGASIKHVQNYSLLPTPTQLLVNKIPLLSAPTASVNQSKEYLMYGDTVPPDDDDDIICEPTEAQILDGIEERNESRNEPGPSIPNYEKELNSVGDCRDLLRKKHNQTIKACKGSGEEDRQYFLSRYSDENLKTEMDVSNMTKSQYSRFGHEEIPNVEVAVPQTYSEGYIDNITDDLSIEVKPSGEPRERIRKLSCTGTSSMTCVTSPVDEWTSPFQSNGKKSLTNIEESFISKERSTLVDLKPLFSRGRSPLSRGRSPLSRGRSPLSKGRLPLSRGRSPLSKGQSPLSRGRSPLSRGRSPLSRGRSPLSRGRSPLSRGRSPLSRGRSPLSRGRSPLSRGRSPLSRGRSPLSRGRSPLSRGRSPLSRGRSPLSRGRSPLSRGRSPLSRGRSPLSRGRSPLSRGRLPLKRGRSPPMRSKSLLNGGRDSIFSERRSPISEEIFRKSNRLHSESQNTYRESNSHISSIDSFMSSIKSPEDLIDIYNKYKMHDLESAGHGNYISQRESKEYGDTDRLSEPYRDRESNRLGKSKRSSDSKQYGKLKRHNESKRHGKLKATRDFERNKESSSYKNSSISVNSFEHANSEKYNEYSQNNLKHDGSIQQKEVKKTIPKVLDATNGRKLDITTTQSKSICTEKYLSTSTIKIESPIVIDSDSISEVNSFDDMYNDNQKPNNTIEDNYSDSSSGVDFSDWYNDSSKKDTGLSGELTNSGPVFFPVDEAPAASSSAKYNGCAKNNTDAQASEAAEFRKGKWPPRRQRTKRSTPYLPEKHPRSKRLPGVFPKAIQPTNMIVIADEDNPVLEPSLFSQKELLIFTGKCMDSFDFMKKVDETLVHRPDNNLYLIIPSFAFLFKSMSILSMTDKTQDNVSSKVRSAEDILYDVFDEFWDMLDDEDLRLLRKCNEAKKIGRCSTLTELLLRHLIYSALYMRNIVRTKTSNCEMIFCGFALHHVSSDAIKHVLMEKLPKNSAEDLVESIMCSVRIFNDFCANTWDLGGFIIKDFSDSRFVKFGKGQTEVPFLEKKLEGFNLDPVDETCNNRLSLEKLTRLMFLNDAIINQVKNRYTSNIAFSVQDIKHQQKSKGSVLPWEKVEGDWFHIKKGMPEVIENSIKTGLFILQKDQNGRMSFECKHCNSFLGIREAEAHLYTRDYRDYAKRIRLKFKHNPEDIQVAKMKLATSASLGENTIPVSKKLRKKLEDYGVIAQTSEENYTCRICAAILHRYGMNKVKFRLHLNSKEHKLMLNKFLGTYTGQEIRLQEYWPLIRKMMCHPPQDVIILTDNVHAKTLSSLEGNNDHIHLLSVPSLVSNDLSKSRQTIDSHVAATSVLSNALWLIVAGKDVLDGEHTVQVLLKHYSYLTRKLPLGHRVIIAPLMPLNVISPDTPNAELLKTFTNSVVSDAPNAERYKNLYKEVMSLHKTTAILGNVKNLSKLQCSAVKVIRDVPITPWHIAIRSYTLSALHGMETEFLIPPRNYEGNPTELDLERRIHLIKIVAPHIQLNIRFSAMSKSRAVLNRDMKFDEEDMNFILFQAAEQKSNEKVIWYLGCNLQQILFSEKMPLFMCNQRQCEVPIKHLIARSDKSVSQILEDIWLFVTKLQDKLPSNNLVTLLPIYPAVFASLPPVIDGVTHTAMHLLREQYPNLLQYTVMHPSHVTMVLQEFVLGWNTLLLKTNKHYHIKLNDLDLHVCQDLLSALSTVSDREAEGCARWISTVNSCIKNFKRYNQASYPRPGDQTFIEEMPPEVCDNNEEVEMDVED